MLDNLRVLPNPVSIVSLRDTTEGTKELADNDASHVIYAVRHGRTAMDISHRCDSHIDLPLSDEGREDVVDTLSNYLKDKGIKCIYTSGLARTWETGHIIATGLIPQPEEEVHEEMLTWNLGNIAGDKKDKERKAIVQDLIAKPWKKAPGGGESYGEFTERFDAFFNNQLAEIKSGEQEGPILDVFSGSNCRRVGELLCGDREAVNLDEGGLMKIFPTKYGWAVQIMDKESGENDEVS